MTLFDQISNDIKAAMLAKDAVRRDTLRGVKKEFLEAKTAKGGDGELSDEDALKIITKMVKKGKDAAEIFHTQGREDLASEEMAQVAVMETYLPKQMSDEELTEAVKAIITETGAEGPKDMGKVMGAASKKLAGLAEGRAISEKVKTLLAAMA
ncbi:MAG: GatB/YqeY domain-containing protein [Bacteroidales bacterium]